MNAKYRIIFSKKGAISFLSHLDTLRLFQCAIKRARLPVAFSKGFNPHQDTSMALPLSIGMDAENDIFEIGLEEAQSLYLETDEILRRMANELPEGIELKEIRKMMPGEKSAASLVRAAEFAGCYPYNKELYDLLKKALATFLDPAEIIIQKRTKSGIKSVDIKPGILKLEISEGDDKIVLRMILLAGNEKTVKPDSVAAKLFEAAGETYEFFRMKFTRINLLLAGENWIYGEKDER